MQLNWHSAAAKLRQHPRIERQWRRWQAPAYQLFYFFRYLVRRISSDDCFKSAGMLAYVTLLAIVPLLTIGFSVLTAFPVFADVTDRLRELMIEHLVPAASETVDEHLESFMGRAAELTAVGIVGLAVSSLLLLNSVERVLNGLWGVRRPRPTVQRFMVYWTVLTVGPLLIGASIAATSGMGAISLGAIEPPSVVVAQLVAIAPFIVQAVVFTLIYAIVPHCRVPVSHAVLGGLCASALFEIAKHGFAAFVTSAPTYEIIYGALAALPIFLLWLYISWWVILIGAEITHGLSNYRRQLTASTLSTQRGALLRVTRLLGHLYSGQRSGSGLTFAELLELEPQLEAVVLAETLEQLRESHIVERSDQGEWLLARDAAYLTLGEIQRRHAYPLPRLSEIAAPESAAADTDPEQQGPEEGSPPEVITWQARLAARLRQAEQDLDQALAVPLSELFAPTERGGQR
ncbi:hypothetical protein CKO15_07095 [Halorhodospira abdelmalekii]|uniref:YihY family inner membrane protein n=1 Tax=Halorhodospira abdelmalekii TaxID=421629 RepID=UPI001908D80E|nr:YihY family inner membrane protein [Halorhodospira abdelmalekii]MBK1735054.1 hypothetical protein [Halorhodospira abdelmalekii]